MNPRDNISGDLSTGADAATSARKVTGDTERAGGPKNEISMLAGLTLAQVAIPALIWITLATSLPLELVMSQVATVGVVLTWLSYSITRVGQDENNGKEHITQRVTEV